MTITPKVTQEKRYGKFTLWQLEQLLSALIFLDEQRKEAEKDLHTNPEKLQAIFTPGCYWSVLYELPLLTHLGVLMRVAGLEQQVIEAAKSADPPQAMLDELGKDDMPAWKGGPDGNLQLKHLAGLLFALTNSLESMVIHSKFLNELVEDVRKGKDKAFFKAVRIDRSIMTCPTFADRITRAELEGDDKFFRKLSKAIRGNPKRPKEEYRDLRFVLYALEDAGGLDGLSIEGAYALLCEELQLYPQDGEDPVRSLWQFISRWKKARST